MEPMDSSTTCSARRRELDGVAGVWEGTSRDLEVGRYEVTARAGDESLGLPILVEPELSVEELHTSRNAVLLARLAESGGGRSLDAADVDELVDLLAPLATVETTEERIDLSRSAWYFALIVLFFTLEWLLRKRVGLV